MTYQNLIVERAAHVATLTLNRPEAYNALDLALGRELFQASLELDEDPDVRCVVITGAGRAFCAGGVGCTSLLRGNDSRNVEPRPGSLSTAIEPPWRDTMP